MPRRPLEVINAICLAILSGLALAFRSRLGLWPEILSRYALMAAFVTLIAFLVRQEERLPRALRVAANFYPAAFIPLVYESLGPLIPAIRGGPRDRYLVAADRALFHVDPTVWLERFVWPPLTDLLYVAYSTYYFFPIALGVTLWLKDPAEARRFIFVVTFCFYVSYAGYFLVPALGPRYALADRQAVVLETTAISRSVSKTLNELEHTKDDAFPSGHTMIAVSVLFVACRRARKLFRVLLPIGVLLIVSTVYCRFHYVVDVLAGVALAFVCVPVGERIYAWACQPRPIFARPAATSD